MIAKFEYENSSSNVDILNNSARLITEFVSEENIKSESANNRANISICLTGIYASIIMALTNSIFIGSTQSPIIAKFFYSSTVILLITSVFNSIRVVLVKQVDKLAPSLINHLESLEQIEALQYEVRWKMWQYNKLNEYNLSKLYYLHRTQRALLLSSVSLLIICVLLFFSKYIILLENIKYVKTVEITIGFVAILFSVLSNQILERTSIWYNSKERKMNDQKYLNKFKKNYKSINLFIVFILIGMIVAFICALLLQGYSFWSSTLLNICGGLFTGLIILVYQYYSKTKLNQATEIVNKLELLKEIPIQELNVLDFCTDYTLPSEEQLETQGVTEKEIFSDDESAAYALNRIRQILQVTSEKIKKIILFEEKVFAMQLDTPKYKSSLDETFQYFNKYSIEKEYIIPAYLLEDYETEAKTKTVSDDCECTNNDYSDETPSMQMVETDVVYYNGNVIKADEVYNEWTEKINSLMKETETFNEKFLNKKNMIIEYHKKSIIIN